MDSNQTAKYIIENNIFMTIATADSNGKPWSSIIGYAYDEASNLYWISSKEARHSINIAERPEVSVSILSTMPEGGFDGVYYDATAEELTDSADIEACIKLFKSQRPHARFAAGDLADVSGDAAWRMYRATPRAIFKRADSVLSGQVVSVREEVNF